MCYNRATVTRRHITTLHLAGLSPDAPHALPERFVSMAQPGSMIDQLRAVTHDQRARIAALPFFTAATGELPLESYAGFLRVLAFLHEAVAEAASDARSACPAEERDELRNRLTLLQQDLSALAPASGDQERRGEPGQLDDRRLALPARVDRGRGGHASEGARVFSLERRLTDWPGDRVHLVCLPGAHPCYART
jgi:hypothetical protein